MRFAWPAVAVLVLGGCGPSGLSEEQESEPVQDFTSAEQGLVSCSSRTDTGYTSGSAFTITVVTADGKPVELSTANAYAVMQAAAAQQGVNIVVVSGFRTMSEQQYLYGCYVNCNCNSCNLAAKPGYSNHQSGHALDLNTSAPGVYNWLTAHGAAYGFKRTVPSEIWHWEYWGGGPGGGPCGNTEDNCTNAEAQGCGNYGCGCVDHACSGGFCPGSGCSAQHTTNCGGFGAGCADGTCAGGTAPGSGCTAKETVDCSKFGCGCVDHKCNGGAACAGTGCTWRETHDCAAFGVNCVDHQCAGGFGPGNGCTGKETTDCKAKGCGCVDHACSGGSACTGSGSTARQATDCAKFGCHSVDGTCSGGACAGNGCTVKQTADCAAMGHGCVDEKCSDACTLKQTADCAAADAGCAKGACQRDGTSFQVDAGPPASAPSDDAGVPEGMLPGLEGPPPELTPDASVPGVVKPMLPSPTSLGAASPASGGCSASALGPLLLAAAAVLARWRRYGR